MDDRRITRLVILVVFIIAVQPSQDEERLLADRFTNYTSAARPTINDNDTVNVTFGMTLSQIIDVHEKNQILVISAWIRQIWTNPILKWEPSDYNNITEINVDPKKVWRPDIVLYNNADEDKTFGGNLDRLNTRVKLRYNGSVTWLAPIILKSKCDIDVRHFPFDTQSCPLKFGSWTYDMNRLNLINQCDTADLENYSNNSEWSLISAQAIRTEGEYFCCPGLFPDVTYHIKIARRSLFYLCNLIFPMTIIGMLTMLSFLLPAESGERVSLAITLLLAMTVFMLVVADIIPATSDGIPLVGIFFSASMIEMVIMIVVLCYIMRLHHKGSNDPPMPSWLRRFVLEWLSYNVHIRVRKEGENEEKVPLFPINKFKKKYPLLPNNHDVNTTVFNKIKHQKTAEVKWENNTAMAYANGRNNGNHNNTQMFDKKPSEAELVIRKLDVFIDKLQTMDEEDLVKTEWRMVAMTIDRCLLIFFAIIFFCTLFGCFLTSPGYVT